MIFGRFRKTNKTSLSKSYLRTSILLILSELRSAFAATRAVIGAYEIDFRILSKNDIRWISARGQGDDADIADRIMFGNFLDVTQRKQAEEANELLAGEMSDRVKNLLQIATALT